MSYRGKGNIRWPFPNCSLLLGTTNERTNERTSTRFFHHAKKFAAKILHKPRDISRQKFACARIKQESGDRCLTRSVHTSWAARARACACHGRQVVSRHSPSGTRRFVGQSTRVVLHETCSAAVWDQFLRPATAPTLARTDAADFTCLRQFFLLRTYNYPDAYVPRWNSHLTRVCSSHSLEHIDPIIELDR